MIYTTKAYLPTSQIQIILMVPFIRQLRHEYDFETLPLYADCAAYIFISSFQGLMKINRQTKKDRYDMFSYISSVYLKVSGKVI